MANDGIPEIENIEILGLVGQGGMSRVYKARQTDLDRIVAVKVLTRIADSDAIQRFKNEAINTSLLDHPNIVKTLSFGVAKNQQPFLLLEYLEGKSLAEIIKQQGSLDYRRFRNIFLPVLSALETAHKKDIVHRDIKPGNIMLCHDEFGKEQVKLVDFGIAKTFIDDADSQRLTKSGAILGSPTYMSPEQCEGKLLDKRSDLYSLSCVMYESLTGEPPFSGESLLEVMQKHVASPAPAVKEVLNKIEVNRDILKTVLWGLEKLPDARPASASSFADKLASALEKITLDRIPLLRSKKNKSSTLFVTGLAVSIGLLTAVGICFNENLRSRNILQEHSKLISTKATDNTEYLLNEKINKLREKHASAAELRPALHAQFDLMERTGDGPAAIRVGEELLFVTPESDPSYFEIMLSLVRDYVNEHKLDQAIDLIKSKNDIIKSGKLYDKFSKVLVCAYLANGDYKQASAVLSSIRQNEKMLDDLNPDKMDTEFLCLSLNLHLNSIQGSEYDTYLKHREMAYELKKEPKQESEYLKALLNCSLAQSLNGQKEKARQGFEKCVLLNGKNVLNRSNLNYTLIALDKLLTLAKNDKDLKKIEVYSAKKSELVGAELNASKGKVRLRDFLADLSSVKFGNLEKEYMLIVDEIDFLLKKQNKISNELRFVAEMTKYKILKGKVSAQVLITTLNECLRYSYDHRGKPTYETASVYAFLAEVEPGRALEFLKKAESILSNREVSILVMAQEFFHAKNVLNLVEVETRIAYQYIEAGNKTLAGDHFKKALELSDTNLRLKIQPLTDYIVFLNSCGRVQESDKELKSFLLLLKSVDTAEYAGDVSYFLDNAAETLASKSYYHQAKVLAESSCELAQKYELADRITKAKVTLQKVQRGPGANAS